MLIDMSKRKCYWCGSIYCFKCTCGYYTCIDCKLFPNEFSCVHRKYVKVESDYWILPDVYPLR